MASGGAEYQAIQLKMKLRAAKVCPVILPSATFGWAKSILPSVEESENESANRALWVCLQLFAYSKVQLSRCITALS